MDQRIVQRLKKLPAFTSGVGALDAEIKQIESQLGLRIPEPYRVFIQTFGYALWDSGSLYGHFVPTEELEGYDFGIAELTRLARKTLKRRKSRLNIDRLIAIEDDQSGGFVFLEDRPGGARVFSISEDDYSAPDQEWPSFEDYVTWLMKQR